MITDEFKNIRAELVIDMKEKETLLIDILLVMIL